MAVWTKKAGFPLITVVSEQPYYNDAGTHVGFDIRLQKRRYFSSLTEQDCEDFIDYPVWLIIRIHNGCVTDEFVRRELCLRLKDTHFYKINTDHAGFYRTTYPQPALERFASPSVARVLSTSDRVGIVADATALCFSGHQSTTGLLDLLFKMRQEPD